MSIFSLRKFALTVAMVACLPFVPTAAHAASAANLPDFADLVDKVGPAVVNIRTTARVPTDVSGLPPGVDQGDMSEFFRRFFGIPMPQPGQPGAPGRPAPRGGDDGGADNGDDQPDQPGRERNSGVASGFILSADGYVMTNAHVVDNADTIYVTLTDKREFKAKLIGVDERTDVAVVKIEAASLPVVTIGDSNKVRVGEWVVAIGSPFGLDNTVTTGIVSAKGRDTGDYLPFIQTDVAVNPGNSGGPLINMQGEVIGINSQIYSRTGGFMGISFAIPIDEAMRVAEQLKQNGKVVRGRIAVTIAQLSNEVAESLGLPKAQGALVANVEPNGPADKAGLLPGDIILKYNGRNIDTATDLPRMVGETKPGTKSMLSVWRKGQIRELPVTVAEMQPDKPRRTASKPQAPKAPAASNPLGLAVSDLPPEQQKALKLRGGVHVEAVEGPAARAGLQRGDIILRVGDTDITGASQFDAVSHALDPSKIVALLVRRGDNTQFVPLRPRSARAQK
jgi:serine protease Do